MSSSTTLFPFILSTVHNSVDLFNLDLFNLPLSHSVDHKPLLYHSIQAKITYNT